MKTLNEHQSYPCPVCRRGDVSALPLMENAFSCSVCQHLFTADFSQQLLKMMDSEIPLSWYWNGQSWGHPQRKGFEFGWQYSIVAFLFIFFPPLIIGTGAYLFPPIAGTPLAWFPLAWTILTFITHLVIFLWLVTEYYQFPVLLYLQALIRQRN